MKLFLDDVRPKPDDSWFLCIDAWSALSLILCYGDNVNEWSLDHDLGEDVRGTELPTGYDFLNMIELLLSCGIKVHVPDRVSVHSSNPAGKRNMLNCLTSIRRWIEEQDDAV